LPKQENAFDMTTMLLGVTLFASPSASPFEIKAQINVRTYHQNNTLLFIYCKKPVIYVLQKLAQHMATWLAKYLENMLYKNQTTYAKNKATCDNTLILSIPCRFELDIVAP